MWNVQLSSSRCCDEKTEIAISDAHKFTSCSFSESLSTMKIQLNNLESCYLSENTGKYKLDALLT